MAKKITENCWEYFKFLLAWIWMDRGKERKYGMEANPEVKTDFSILEKKWEIEEEGIPTSSYLRNSYYNYLKIYTDGSKNKLECVGIRIHIPEFKINISKRLSDMLSIRILQK